MQGTGYVFFAIYLAAVAVKLTHYWVNAACHIHLMHSSSIAVDELELSTTFYKRARSLCTVTLHPLLSSEPFLSNASLQYEDSDTVEPSCRLGADYAAALNSHNLTPAQPVTRKHDIRLHLARLRIIYNALQLMWCDRCPMDWVPHKQLQLLNVA